VNMKTNNKCIVPANVFCPPEDYIKDHQCSPGSLSKCVPHLNHRACKRGRRLAEEKELASKDRISNWE